tara:strand:- start:137 stop:385 length:249 start_codon:yes stop_codon:yes gene_type:complete
MTEVITVLTLVVAVTNFGWSLYNYKRIEDIKGKMDRERFCRYPDTDVRDILIDYELEKAKKLDKAIHEVEDEIERKKYPKHR